ncbi:MAG TPA: hypothetical protein VJ938_13125 [Acidimicrobiia bacterium]|nr:hypothetical protein [Acidimicrobiia bacterium]
MSDQLAAAAQAMGVPQPIVERSARAWATASGASFDDVLAGWAGGAPVATAAPAESPPAEAEAAPAPAESEPTPAPEAAPAPSPPPAEPVGVPVAAAVVVEEPEEPIEPLALGERLRLGGKIGAWTGGVLGLLGFVFGSTWLLSAASLAGEEGALTPAVEVTTSRLILATTLLSVLFGIIVATLSRAAAGWVDRGARLEGRWAITVLMGAGLGLVLGVAAGAVMVSAFSEPIEGAEGMALMRVIPAIVVVLLGGGVLGWLTAVVVQVVGVPATVDEDAAAEIADVRGRLSAAVSIPVAALLLLGLLVLPLGITFIRSNEMAGGGAAVLAIFAAASILGIGAMSASRPTMRVTRGELMVAVAGIATVVIIVFAVIQARAPETEEESTEETATETTVESTTDTTVTETTTAG